MPLITFEGVDGSGKSLQVEMLYQFLSSQGIKTAKYREPGGTNFSEYIREFLMDHEGLWGADISPFTELMLFQASRAQLIAEQVGPKLAEGWVVILDRFICSSAVYQGWNDGVGMPRALEASLVATQGITPDVSLFIDTDPQIAMNRLKSRNDGNRFDSKDVKSIEKTRLGYQKWYDHFCPYPYAIIDGDGSVQSVSNSILEVVWTDAKIIPERLRTA